MMKHKGIYFIVCGMGFLLATTVILVVSKQQGQENICGKSGPIVSVQKVKYTDVEESLALIGTVEAVDKTTLYQAANDTIIRVNKRIGDSVDIGESIVEYQEVDREKLMREIDNIDLKIENTYLAISNLVDPDNRQQLATYRTQLTTIDKGTDDLNEAIRQTNEKLNLAQTMASDAKREQELVEKLFESGVASEEELRRAKQAAQEKQEQVTALDNKLTSLSGDLSIQETKKQEVNYDIDLLTNKGNSKEAQRQVTMKKNEISTLQNQKKDLEEQLDKLTQNLVSPVKGNVLEVFVKDGEIVKADKPIMTVMNNEHQIIKLELTPEDAPFIEVGQTCQFIYEGKVTTKGTGIVKRIAPGIIEEQKANGSIEKKLLAEIEIQDVSAPIIDGEEVEVNICTVNLKHVLKLPKSVIVEDNDGQYYVYVVQDNKVAKKMISIKEAIKESVIVEGISEEELVIMSDIKDIENGMSIRYNSGDSL